MPERSSKKRVRDLRPIAAGVVDETKGDNPEIISPEITGKNPHAAALGHLGGIKGGLARAQKLSAERRSEIARKAAQVRWHGKQGSPEDE